MWVSKRRWQSLVCRVEELERGIPVADENGWPERVSTVNAIQLIVDHLGLRFLCKEAKRASTHLVPKDDEQAA